MTEHPQSGSSPVYPPPIGTPAYPPPVSTPAYPPPVGAPAHPLPISAPAYPPPASTPFYAQGVPPGLARGWPMGMVPSPPPPRPAPPRKRTPRERWQLAGSLALVLVISLVFSALVGWGYHVSQATVEHTSYGYDIVDRRTVPATQPFRVILPVGESWTNAAGANPWAGVVDIYTDAALTRPYPYLYTRMGDDVRPNAVFISSNSRRPGFSANVADLQDELVSLGGDERWPAGTYYLVEREDAFGARLDTPRVHVFTVEAEPGMVTPPDFTMDVVNGVPHFEWTEVENAVGYYIVQISEQQTPPPPSAYAPQTRTMIVGTTTGTSWLATDQDMAYHNAHQNSVAVSQVNNDFRAEAANGLPCEPQDATYTGTEPADFDTSELVFPSYAVVAIAANDDTSLPIPLDGTDLVTNTPVATAEHTLEAMATAAGTPLALPPSHPVTMGDCRTAFLPITPTVLVSAEGQTSATVEYITQGSPLTGEITSTEGDAAGYAQVMAVGAAAGLRGTIQRGPAEDAGYMPAEDVDDYAAYIEASGTTPTSEVPEAPYAWNGSSDMVKYIAAHMFAGNLAIDMSQFTADPASPLILDAANEALLQNPYITDMSPYIGVLNDVLYVDYEQSVEDRAASAARIKAKVDEVVGALITPDMSERDKALVLNDWLARNAIYDHAGADWSVAADRTRDEFVASYPTSWDAEGVLLNGTGVCTSYATAYKALADAAGLTTVTVTGLADDSGIGHQWIKAYLDGRWQVIDPTWNSNVYEQIGSDTDWFFGLTDAEAERTQFDGFSVDSLIPTYDAW